MLYLAKKLRGKIIMNVDAELDRIRNYIASFPDKIINWHTFCATLPKINSEVSKLKDIDDIRREIERVERELQGYVLSIKIMIRMGITMLDDLNFRFADYTNL